MICSVCHSDNPAGATRCFKCSSSFDLEEPRIDANAATLAGPAWSQPAESVRPSKADLWGALQPGTLIAERYEILELIGQGGMGAVYKARDRELGRIVALKVIRPDLASNPEILKRFKQELILARQISHRNVIRIFDLGVAGELRFITMEYLEGRSLAALMAERQFTPSEAADIVAQVCRGLEAAHAEGVIHRDLKPQNIMIEAQGRACVMDFGLARSMEDDRGMTRTGVLMGTPDYMSPEQAKAQKVDARSDIYSLGLIFYELLTRNLPFRSESLLDTLLARTRERPAPARQLNSEVPQALSDIVDRCLQTDPARRYQSASDLIHDLEGWLAGAAHPGQTRLRRARLPRLRSWKPIAAAAAVLIALAAVSLFRWTGSQRRAIAPSKPLTVLVADFTNTTGDSVFDGTLEPSVALAMEGAPSISAFNRGQARRLGAQLKPGAAQLDEALARLVAVREGINAVVSGSIAKSGPGYAISIRVLDPVTGKLIGTQEREAAGKQEVLKAAAALVPSVLNALGAAPESVRSEDAETFSAASLEAAHSYAVAQEQMWAGKWADAIKGYELAVKLDPKLGRAYAGLAVTHANLKKYSEAGQYYKKALALLDRMSERERYRTLGAYYLTYVRNYGKAIDSLHKLVSAYPSDSAGYNNLSIAYAYARNLPDAVSASKRALAINPSNVQTRLNFAIYSMLAGDFDNSIAETGRILNQNPGYEFAYLPLALSRLAKGDIAGAREAYARLEALSPAGYSLGKAGEGDLELYVGRNEQAVAALDEGIRADQKENNSGEMAMKYVAKAEAQLASGRRAEAIQSASKASELSPVPSVLYPAARVLLEAGDESKARRQAALLEGLLQNESKAAARLITGEIALRQKRFPEALDALQESQKLQDSWISHFLLGVTYAEAGHFAEALAELETCKRRKGEAADLFFADTATLRYLAPLSYWLGRTHEGLGTLDDARTGYQEFLNLRSTAKSPGALVMDARRRLAAVSR